MRENHPFERTDYGVQCILKDELKKYRELMEELNLTDAHYDIDKLFVENARSIGRRLNNYERFNIVADYLEMGKLRYEQ